MNLSSSIGCSAITPLEYGHFQTNISIMFFFILNTIYNEPFSLMP